MNSRQVGFSRVSDSLSRKVRSILARRLAVKLSLSAFRGLPIRLSFLLLSLCLAPAFADAICTTGSTGGSCPGFFAGPPFATPFLPVPESLGQFILPPGVFVVAGDVLVFDDPGFT